MRKMLIVAMFIFVSASIVSAETPEKNYLASVRFAEAEYQKEITCANSKLDDTLKTSEKIIVNWHAEKPMENFINIAYANLLTTLSNTKEAELRAATWKSWHEAVCIISQARKSASEPARRYFIDTFKMIDAEKVKARAKWRKSVMVAQAKLEFTRKSARTNYLNSK